MWYLFDSFGTPFLVVQMAFTVWMLVDAYQRSADYFWYFIIFFFQPIGTWAYFFAVKMRGFHWSSGSIGSWMPERKMSLEELRYHVNQAPTTANRMALSHRLMQRGEHMEAIPLLEAVVAFEPTYGIALYSLAECRLECNQPDEAVELLQKLNAKDPRWSDYRAWRLLVEAYEAQGQHDQAVHASREYAKYKPTLEVKCLLAEQLLAEGNANEVEKILRPALEDHRFSRFGLRWRNRSWAAKAHGLLGQAQQIHHEKAGK